ncbi:hypothetical protein CKJ81_04445 [Corynebacterium hadale]|uniref:Uncharacterized protein n=1 Tax=Corynebacterium hadale TaxID=2026255 RepID=A0ABX4HA72_9CORY|nr:hypothetical protein CKJ81_04445 [Corynebacterium hadale]
MAHITASEVAAAVRSKDPGSPLASPSRYQHRHEDHVTFMPVENVYPPLTLETRENEQGYTAYTWRAGSTTRNGTWTSDTEALIFTGFLRDYLMGR